jgi:predicted RNA-binding Zn ribbon-like protein
VDFTSYAELAVRLVNTTVRNGARRDSLASPAAFRALVADRPHLHGQLTHHDLDAMRQLRDGLTAIFSAAAEGRDTEAADRLNALLVQYPMHPVLVRHGGPQWHLHLDDVGSVADRYASGAVIGLARTVAQYGIDRLGVCAIASCHAVFIDASSNRSRRYCSDHAVTRANLTALQASGSAGSGRAPSTAAG